IRQVLLLRIAAQVGEGEDSDGWLVRELEGWSGRFNRPFVACHRAESRHFPHRAHEAETLARQRLDQPLGLAAVADGVSCNIAAGCEGGVENDAPAPDGSN